MSLCAGAETVHLPGDILAPIADALEGQSTMKKKAPPTLTLGVLAALIGLFLMGAGFIDRDELGICAILPGGFALVFGLF